MPYMVGEFGRKLGEHSGEVVELQSWILPRKFHQDLVGPRAIPCLATASHSHTLL